MYKVTVIITTYNLENEIGKCLEELYNQSFKAFNIVIVDDCSKDKTFEVIKSYKGIFGERLYYERLKENQGMPSKTRNYALKSQHVEGEYVVFLDGDDSIEPNYLERLYETALETAADIVICAYDRVEQDTGKVLCKEMLSFPERIDRIEGATDLCFINGSLWNKIFKTDSIKGLEIPNITVGEDLCFQLSIYRRCHTIVSIKDILIHYKVRGDSVMSNTKEETIYQLADELEKQFKMSNDNFKDIVALVALIHVGLSMTIRAYQNPSINIKEHLKWTNTYFKRCFNRFNGCKSTSFGTLSHYGVRGYAIWFCKILYKLSLFKLFLYSYSFVTKVLHIDFKF